jgi:hypothetical protein
MLCIVVCDAERRGRKKMGENSDEEGEDYVEE